MPTKSSSLSPENLSRLEALVNRHCLTASSSEESFLWELASLALERYQREHGGQPVSQEANSGEGATLVASSPVGASACEASTPLLSLDDRPEVARAGHHLLDPTPCPSEIPVIVGSAATPARGTGQRA